MSEIQIVRVTTAAVVVGEVDFDRLLEQARENEELRKTLSQRLQELEEIRTAARSLLRYLDDHDWGTIPEGVTADELRELAWPSPPHSTGGSGG